MSKSFAVLEQFCYWPPGKFKGKEDPAQYQKRPNLQSPLSRCIATVRREA
jgi:hypothetical protein